jgi:hypothetical protein
MNHIWYATRGKKKLPFRISDRNLRTYLITTDGIRGEWPGDKKVGRPPFLISNIAIPQIETEVPIVVWNYMSHPIHLHRVGTKDDKIALGQHLGEIGTGLRGTFPTQIGRKFYVMARTARMRFTFRDPLKNSFGVFKQGVGLVSAASISAQSYTGRAIKFRNFAEQPAGLYFDNGGEGAFQVTMMPGEEISLNGFTGQRLFFAEQHDSEAKRLMNGEAKRLMNVTISQDQLVYMLTPTAGTKAHYKV